MITAFLLQIAALIRQDLTADSRLHTELAELPVRVAFLDPEPEGDHITLTAEGAENLIPGEHLYRVTATLAIVVYANSRTAARARALLAAAGGCVLRTLSYGWHDRSLPELAAHVYSLDPELEPLQTVGSAYETRLAITANVHFYPTAPPCVG